MSAPRKKGLRLHRWRNPIWQLFLSNMYVLTRSGSSWFWMLGFPVIIAVVLGIAFRGQSEAAPTITVGVADGPDADAIAARLEALDLIKARRTTLARGEAMVQSGDLNLVLVPAAEPGGAPELVVDPTQVSGVAARELVINALEAERGNAPAPVPVLDRKLTAPGARYIDFLIPGLLGLTLMNQTLTVGMVIVWMRKGKLLRRLMATPMSKLDFLLSAALTRIVLALFLVVTILVFGQIAFGVHVAGSWLLLGFFTMMGALAFCGLGLLLGSRSDYTEVVGGITQLATLAMLVGSGVFFPVSKFPEAVQPLLGFLPLTALTDGLRMIINDGASLAEVSRPILVLAGHGVVTLVLALRLFSWH